RDGHVTGVQTCALPISITFPSYNPPQQPLNIQVRYVGSSSSAQSSLTLRPAAAAAVCVPTRLVSVFSNPGSLFEVPAALPVNLRSEERRVGKEWRSGWW